MVMLDSAGSFYLGLRRDRSPKVAASGSTRCLRERDSKEDVALRIAQCQLVEKGN